MEQELGLKYWYCSMICANSSPKPLYHIVIDTVRYTCSSWHPQLAKSSKLADQLGLEDAKPADASLQLIIFKAMQGETQTQHVLLW